VLSLLKNLFGSNQNSALADYVRGSLMAHYKKTKRASKH
jgi:hypothetical protein